MRIISFEALSAALWQQVPSTSQGWQTRAIRNLATSIAVHSLTARSAKPFLEVPEGKEVSFKEVAQALRKFLEMEPRMPPYRRKDFNKGILAMEEEPHPGELNFDPLSLRLA